MLKDILNSSTGTAAILGLKPLPIEGDVLIAAAEVPDYLGVKMQTLARWRHEGFGPPWVRMGRLIYYRSSDLHAWIESRLCKNTVAA